MNVRGTNACNLADPSMDNLVNFFKTSWDLVTFKKFSPHHDVLSGKMNVFIPLKGTEILNLWWRMVSNDNIYKYIYILQL